MGERLGPPIIPDRKEFIPPEPSEDLAWMLGVLSAAGTISHYFIRLNSRHLELCEELSRVSDKVCNFPGILKPAPYSGSYGIHFNNTSMIRYLGDLSRGGWPDEIKKVYRWIYNDQKYLISFVRGFFDARGAIHNPERRHCVDFFTAEKSSALELKSILELFDIQNSRFALGKSHERERTDLAISNIAEIVKLAHLIHSVVPEKEEKLEIYRNFKVEGRSRGVRGKRVKVLSSPFKEESIKIPLPSSDLAYFLGIMTGGGNISGGNFIKQGIDREVVEEFKTIAEKVFNVQVSLKFKSGREKTGRKNTYQASFTSKKLANFIGDLRNRVWTQTIRDKHTWLYTNNEYLWNFLRGYFDVRGGINDPRMNKQANYFLLTCSGNQAADEIARILVQLGFEKISIARKAGKKRGEASAVRIDNYDQIVYLAKNIYSKVPFKEKRLSLYRNSYTIYIKPEVLEAYETVMRVRRETGLGNKTILSHPDLQKYVWLTESLVGTWIYFGVDPHNNRKRIKIIFPDTD